MRVLVSLVAVLVLMAVAYFGAGSSGGQYLFGVIIPYAAMALFVLGVIYRVLNWAKSPVPFRITTTCGQQRSLPWIKNNNLENPHNILGVLGRMALEVLCFRSLFRNTKVEIRKSPKFKFVYGGDLYLWLGALAFHWSFLLIFIRHYRFFAEPVPGFYRAVFIDSLKLFVRPQNATGLVFVTAAVCFKFFTGHTDYSFTMGAFRVQAPVGWVVTLSAWGCLFWYYMEIICTTANDTDNSSGTSRHEYARRRPSAGW